MERKTYIKITVALIVIILVFIIIIQAGTIQKQEGVINMCKPYLDLKQKIYITTNLKLRLMQSEQLVEDSRIKLTQEIYGLTGRLEKVEQVTGYVIDNSTTECFDQHNDFKQIVLKIDELDEFGLAYGTTKTIYGIELCIFNTELKDNPESFFRCWLPCDYK